MLLRNTILTVLFSLISMVCAWFAMIYPAWVQQHYTRDGNDVFQGFGIFSFYSTSALQSPFYASETTLQYGDFCDAKTVPNYMLGDGDQFRKVLCGSAMKGIQITTCVGAGFAVLGLIGAVLAVYNPSAGKAEKVVSGATLLSSLLLAVSLVIWGWMIQQNLYNVDSIKGAYNTCKADKKDWNCWFYGYSFWVCLAAVILMSITGYLSSAGRAEKIRYFRKEYERDLAIAVQASLQTTAANPTGAPLQTTQTQQNTANYNYEVTPSVAPLTAIETGSHSPYSDANYQNYAQHQQQYQQQHQYNDSELTYPAFKQERKDQSFPARLPSGGVV